MSAVVTMLAVGVGNCFGLQIAPYSVSSLPLCPPAHWLSSARGVGHIFTAVCKSGPPSPWIAGAFAFCAFGVGQFCPNPDALAPVGSPGVVRSHNAPSRIIPQRGKVKQDQCKPSSNKHW
jgi:hypothetical protein